MKKFSVLMSVYHRERGEFLRTALASVFEQTVVPAEVVLVEDGPLTEELYGVIAEFRSAHETLKIVKLPKNVGLGEALNQGLAQCSYDLVARMDSDDICFDDRFEQQLRAFDAHPDVAVVGGWISEFESNPAEIIAYRKLPQTHEDLSIFFRSKSPLNHVTVMFRKSQVEMAGGYQPFYLLEDYWLWARMIANGDKLYNVQSILVNVRGGTAMAARRGGWRYAMSEIKLQRKMLAMGLIGVGAFCKNVAVRFTVRMMPNKLRAFVYKKILR